MVKEGIVKLYKITFDDQMADSLKRAMPQPAFERHHGQMLGHELFSAEPPLLEDVS